MWFARYDSRTICGGSDEALRWGAGSRAKHAISRMPEQGRLRGCQGIGEERTGQSV